MNILCFDPAYENHDYINAIQEMKDLRFQRGISREKTIDPLHHVSTKH